MNSTVSGAHRLQVKIFIHGSAPPLEPFIPVFHQWIKQKRFPELLIDVANYAHVPKGPGVGLVGHESEYFIDQGEGRAGLLYTRKRDGSANGDGLGRAFRRALHAAILLEREEAFAGTLRFGSNELQLCVADRLRAPSSPATFAALRPELDAFCSKLFGSGGYQLTLASTPRQLFTVAIGAEGDASLAELLERLGGPLS